MKIKERIIVSTIKDVAKKAGVSISVVSKAFNNYPDISEKTRQKVLKVAEELNYSPNLVAKNLSLKRPMTIGLISSGFSDNDNRGSNIPFEIFRGVYQGLIESDYELAIYLTSSQEQHKKSYAQFCKERNIGGVILQGIRIDDPYFEEMVASDIPCVLIDARIDSDANLIGSVSIDNINATKEMALHLLDHNHRKIAVMAGKKSAYVDRWRMQGFKEALAQYGLTISDEDILYGRYLEDVAYKEAKEYLKRKRPTAFLCFSDLMALGVMRAVNEAGLCIPEDISVTGFDGLPITDYTQPPLTTIKQNFFEMGRQASNLLIHIIEGKDTKEHVYVDYQFLKRKSVQTLGY